jgi:hypothetical protein
MPGRVCGDMGGDWTGTGQRGVFSFLWKTRLRLPKARKARVPSCRCLRCPRSHPLINWMPLLLRATVAPTAGLVGRRVITARATITTNHHLVVSNPATPARANLITRRCHSGGSRGGACRVKKRSSLVLTMVAGVTPGTTAATADTILRGRARSSIRVGVLVPAAASAAAGEAGGMEKGEKEKEKEKSNDEAKKKPPASSLLYPHLNLDFKPKLRAAELAWCIVTSTAAALLFAVAVARVNVEKFLAMHAKQRALTAVSLACVFGVNFLVTRWLAREAQEQARLVSRAEAGRGL